MIFNPYVDGISFILPSIAFLAVIVDWIFPNTNVPVFFIPVPFVFETVTFFKFNLPLLFKAIVSSVSASVIVTFWMVRSAVFVIPFVSIIHSEPLIVIFLFIVSALSKLTFSNITIVSLSFASSMASSKVEKPYSLPSLESFATSPTCTSLMVLFLFIRNPICSIVFVHTNVLNTIATNTNSIIGITLIFITLFFVFFMLLPLFFLYIQFYDIIFYVCVNGYFSLFY